MKIKKIPVALKLLLPLIFGILVSYFYYVKISFPIVLGFAFVTTVACLPPLNHFFSLRKWLGFLVMPLFFSLGAFLENLNDGRNNETYFLKKSEKDSLNFYHLKIVEPPVIKGQWVKCEVNVAATNGEPSSGKAQLYIEKNDTSKNLKYGDLIYANIQFIEVNEPTNPHEFDYKEYLRINDIHHQAFIHQSQWVQAGNDANSFFEFIFDVRDKCNSILEESNMSAENIAVAKALIIGDKELIDDELMLSYAASGALHVLAVSGLHVGIIMLILTFILKPLKRLKNGKIIFIVITISGVWFYSIITGLSPSVLRAAVMFSFVILGSELQRDTSIYQSLLISALLLILIDPHIIFKIGFLLSYLAVFGIVFFHPKIFALFHFKNFILRKTWQITSISIAAQIATFPLGIFCFQQFPNFFLLANLIVIPVSFVVLIVGISYLVTVSIPIISDVFLFILDWALWALNISVRWVEELPFSVYRGISIEWYDVILLYGFIFSLTFAILNRRKKLLIFSLLLLTFSVSLNYLEKYQSQNKNEVVIYSIKNEIAIDVFYGQKICFFSTKSLADDENKKRYHIYPNRHHRCGNSLPHQLTFIDSTNHIIEIEKIKMLVLNQRILNNNYPFNFPITDFIYLHDIQSIPKNIVDHFSHQKTKIIFGFGVSSQVKFFVKKKIPNHFICDLKKSGAIQVHF